MSFRTSGGGSAVRARRKLRGFVFRRYFFYGQTFTAHGRGGLVTFAAPKVTKRRSIVIRNASLPHRPLRTIRQNHGLQHTFPTDRSRSALASESAAMPVPSAPPTTVLPDFGRSCSADHTGPTLFICHLKICLCEEPARACALAATWQSQGMPLDHHPTHP